MLKTIKNSIISMLTVAKHLFKRPVTLEYPEKKIVPPVNFRGKPVVEGCIKCGVCMKVCPTGAINIEDNKYMIDLNKCIFCGNCSYYCRSKAIKMSFDYELASVEKEDLVLTYEIEKEDGSV